jgi:hypothetical protein
MNPDLLNMYIEQLLNEITEGVKTRILLQTQLKFTEKMNAELQLKITNLESQIEKNNKKKQKEVNTSSDNF